MKRVKDHQFLYDRGGSYYFRRAVPEGAEYAFGGKTEVVVALGTRSLAQARHLLIEHLRRFDKQLSALRGTTDPTAKIVPVARAAVIPDRREIDGAVREWLNARLEEGLPERLFVQPDLARQHAIDLSAQRMIAGARLTPGSAVVDLSTSWVAESLAERHGWSIEPGDPQWSELERMIDRAKREQAYRQLSELNGEPLRVLDGIFSPEHDRLDAERRKEAAERPKARVSITKLLDRYLVENKVAPATEKAWRRMLTRLKDFLDNDDAHAITTADLIRWKEHLLQETDGKGNQRSPRTVREGYLAAAKAVFGWAVENHVLPTNPAEKVKVRKEKRQRLRDPGFTNDEALTILKATRQPSSSRLTQEMTRARRWVPWLCAYTGARVGEMAQLRAEDIHQVDGHWIVHITPEAGSVKNGQARDVPLHAHLIEQGLLEVVAELKGPLFYNRSRQRGGKAGNPQYKKVGERLAEWVRELGVNDPNIQPNHAWRHRFKTITRRCNIHQDTANAIQGHAPSTDSEGYGQYGDLEAMVEAIKQVPRYGV